MTALAFVIFGNTKTATSAAPESPTQETSEVIDYMIVAQDLRGYTTTQKFSAAVKSKMAEGWEPMGGINVMNEVGQPAYQALVKRK